MTVDEARKTLNKHGYVFGRSNTSAIRDVTARAEIKAACLVLRRAGEQQGSAAATPVVRPVPRGE